MENYILTRYISFVCSASSSMILYAALKGSDLNLRRCIRVDLRKLNETVHFYALSDAEGLMKACMKVH